MALHIDYRPKNLLEFVGNDATKSALESWFGMEDRNRTILFAGPTGCGKTTLARIAAQEVGCDELNLKEYNIADARGIDDARKIIREASYMPIGAPYRVFILDEFQQATPQFQDSMLKTLEEPPKTTIFVLCTTKPEALRTTILNRCTRYDVKPLRALDIRKLLHHVIGFEGVKSFPKKAVERISQACQGIPRHALTLLGKVIDMSDDDLIIEAIDREVVYEVTIADLCVALMDGHPWERIAPMLKGLQTEDAEGLRHAVLSWLTKKALASTGAVAGRCFKVIANFESSFFYSSHSGLALACFRSITN